MINVSKDGNDRRAVNEVARVFRSDQPFPERDFSGLFLFNLFINNSHLLIAAIGETVVILSGGIDLSVGQLPEVLFAVVARIGGDQRVLGEDGRQHALGIDAPGIADPRHRLRGRP